MSGGNACFFQAMHSEWTILVERGWERSKAKALAKWGWCKNNQTTAKKHKLQYFFWNNLQEFYEISTGFYQKCYRKFLELYLVFVGSNYNYFGNYLYKLRVKACTEQQKNWRVLFTLWLRATFVTYLEAFCQMALFIWMSLLQANLKQNQAKFRP